jgi:hypothetical protein
MKGFRLSDMVTFRMSAGSIGAAGPAAAVEEEELELEKETPEEEEAASAVLDELDASAVAHSGAGTKQLTAKSASTQMIGSRERERIEEGCRR